MEERVQTLVGHEPRDRADDRGRGFQPEFGADALPLSPVHGRIKPLSVDAHWNDADLIGRGHLARQPPRLDVFTIHRNRIAQARRESFQQGVQSDAPGAEVFVKREGVRRVDDHRHPRQARCDPADHPSLGRLHMDHVEAAAGKVAVQLDDRPQIQERRDVSAHRQNLDLEALAPQEPYKGLAGFPWVVRADQHHLMALLPQILGERQDEGHLDARLRGHLEDVHAAGEPFIVFPSLGTTGLSASVRPGIRKEG